MAINEDAFPEAYQALREVCTDLISKIATSSTDQNVLIARAKDKGLVQSVQASATVTLPGPQSKKEKAEQLVTQVLQAVKTDGTKIDAFLQLLEETSLGDIALYLHNKLQEYTSRHGEGTTPPDDLQPSQRPGSGSGCVNTTEHGSQPKLEPASAYDSAFEEASNSVTQDGDAGSSQHQMAAADTTTNTSFKPLSSSAGVVHVIVEQNHTDNLVVETEDSVLAVIETQPHSEGQSPVTSISVPVLPEVKRMAQENKDLQAQLAEKTSSEEILKKDLKQVQVERDKIQRELDKKEEELKAVKEEKDSQIQALKKEMEHLKEELKNEKENNVAEKAKYEKEIKRLKQELKEKEDHYHKEKIRLMEEKHELELEIEKMHTKEERMLRQISEEKVKVAELRAEKSEQNSQLTRVQSEQAMEDLKKQHQTEMEAVKRKHSKELGELQMSIGQTPPNTHTTNNT